MADWEVALDRQLATWLWLHGPKGQEYIDSYLRSVKEKYPWEVPAWERMQQNVVTALWRADPVYVTREMFALMLHARETFQPEPLREEELLLKDGFAYFPQGTAIVDVRGKRVGVRAIAWSQATFTGWEDWEGRLHPYGAIKNKRGVIVTFLSQYGDPDDYFDSQTPAEQARGRAYFEDSLMVAHQLPLVYGETPDRDRSATRVVAQDDDPEGTPPLDPARVAASAMDAFLLCQVLWRLMGQRIGVGFRQRPNRAARRRVERAGWEEKYITVVTLRRPRQQGGEEQRHVDWSHRWVVSGHWRWQPYGDGTVRQIWISPYVKGPDDKPLVIRGARVFRLAR